MKITIDLELEDICLALERRSSHSDAWRSLWKFSEYLRGQYKYIEEDKRPDLEAIRDKFHEYVRNLRFDE